MAKICGPSGYILTFVPRLIRFCFVMVTVGSTCDITAADPIVESVTASFYVTDSPVWLGSVYFIADHTLRTYHPDTGKSIAVQFNNVAPLTFLVPIRPQRSSDPTKFAIGFGQGVGVFEWNGTSTNKLSHENYLAISKEPREFVECGKSDANGRLWVATNCVENATDNGKGKVYMVDPSGTVTGKLENIAVPGNIAWSPNSDRFYYTTMKSIVGHSFKIDTSELVNDGKDVFDFASHGIKGYLDGMTVDTDGNLWVACNKNSIVLKIDPNDGTILMQVNFPETASITSVVFGGSELNDLYVTTELEDPNGAYEFPKSGSMFRVSNTGSTGTRVMEIIVNWHPEGNPGP